MPDSALREFGQEKTHHPRSEVLQVKDVHTKWHNFVATTVEALHRYFPAKRVTVHPTKFTNSNLLTTDSAWSSSLTLTQQQQLEDVQKRACKIILGPSYTNYDHALTILSLPRLSTKHREALVKRGFVISCHLTLLTPSTPHVTTMWLCP
ncbi:hypothetical protein E2C01_052512 [Portunus trituberculatus]|uniref:Uncharacterized protein n=1 Tax=Portunus trituberculatus TaxID=210409 RepID=A0A5B7GLR0_PORTR|nr:hypothetical protein [Portunus trituberculatus]